MIQDLSFTKVEAINKTAANLYDDQIPLSNRIISFLNDLISLVYYDRATILFFYKNEDGIYEKHSSISVNWESDSDVVKTYDDHYCHVDDTLPVFDQPNTIIFRSSSFFDLEARNDNAYWHDYLIPINCYYSLEGNLQLDPNQPLLGAFNLYRGREKSDFSDTDEAIMSLFQPHLSNVLKYYGTRSDNSGLMFALDSYNCAGIATLDSNCQIVRSNAKYKNMIKDKQYGTSIAAKLVTMCMELSQKDVIGEFSSLEYKFPDAPIFMEVSTVSSNSKDNIQYTCMVYDLSHFISETLHAAKSHYTLSPREFEIFQAVLNGQSNEEIAEEMFLSLSTVKKYLASIYGKMNIKNQKQIFEKLNLM